MALALVLSLFIVAYNNVINRWEPFHAAAYVPANLAFTGAVTLAAASAAELSPAELGLGGDLSSVFVVLSAVALFAVVMLLLARSRSAHRLADRRVARLRAGGLAYHVLVRIPVGTGVAEEVVFRGALFAAWVAAGHSDINAALYSSVAFGLWHVSPTIIGVRMNDPNASVRRVTVAVVGAVVLTTGVGLALTWLRVETGGLLVPIVLHGGINSTAAYAAVLAHRHTRAHQVSSVVPS
jgi:membrane protease YdiL (CAAX protease family)